MFLVSITVQIFKFSKKVFDRHFASLALRESPVLECIDCDLSEVAKNNAPTLSDSLPCDGQFAKQIALFHSSSLRGYS